MKCIYCNTPLASISYCPGCGADVTLLKRIGRISNLLYNRGLEKASVRDLSGAIATLSQSLKFNKENTDARNLLGLCYYETGEVVSALCEWVISKNMKGEDNLADAYIKALQGNKNSLDVINQSIRKYNQSIEYCREGHEDMAIMQLRKVVARNPKLVKAQQLLALLYMKNQDYEKARRMLRKASAIDNTNTTTLRYLTEIELLTGRTSAFGSRRRRKRSYEEEDRNSLRYISGNETIIAPATFRDSSSVATFINIGLGMLLGGAIIWFMAIPASRQSMQEKANQTVTDVNLKLAGSAAQLAEMQSQIDGYEAQILDANQERDDALKKATGYDDLLGVASLYLEGNQTGAVDAIGRIDDSLLEGNAKTLYDDLMASVSTALFSQYFTTGTVAYTNRDFATAAEQLELAVASDPNATEANFFNAIYYLGFAYFNLGDSANADRVFTDLLERYPGQESVIRPYISSGSSAGAAATAGESGQGAASMSQDNSWSDTSGQDAITIYGDDQNSLGYDPADVAWTDPNTGLHYDMYGNLLG